MSAKTPEEPPANQIVKYSPDQLIIKEGDYGASAYRIVKGQVRVLKELQSGTTLMAEFGEGEIFGEMGFIDGGFLPPQVFGRSKRGSGAADMASNFHYAGLPGCEPHGENPSGTASEKA